MLHSITCAENAHTAHWDYAYLYRVRIRTTYSPYRKRVVCVLFHLLTLAGGDPGLIPARGHPTKLKQVNPPGDGENQTQCTPKAPETSAATE